MSDAEKDVSNSALGMPRLEKVLNGEIALDDMTDAEAAIWHRNFDENMRNPGKDPRVKAAYAKLAEENKKVGYSED